MARPRAYPSWLRRGAAAVAAILATAATAGCSPSGPTTGDGQRVSILVSFYPLQFLAERIAGPDATVTSLTPPGAEPHDLELSPAQVAEIGRANLVVYLSGFQPAVDEAIAARTPAHVVDAAALTQLQPLGDDGASADSGAVLDPHFWLDPSRMAPVAQAIAKELAAIVPDQATTIDASRDAVTDDLTALDTRFTEGLATCERRTVVVTHAAFGYLAQRYDLTQLSVGGIDPDSEPSPARIREVAAALEGTGVTTVFFESQASPSIARTLAEQVGLTAEVLDPLEASAPGDYITRMDTDLATLRAALECS
ncbi:MAG: metal ABC transporter substrate-binding protein [Bifidobacteriaceae bacterium]|jgi:zinc transport system substrate-binding protein|nr:metal ABC transporter substrate-binding protein [Bifidobacteriaceae bacterium]